MIEKTTICYSLTPNFPIDFRIINQSFDSINKLLLLTNFSSNNVNYWVIGKVHWVEICYNIQRLCFAVHIKYIWNYHYQGTAEIRNFKKLLEYFLWLPFGKLLLEWILLKNFVIVTLIKGCVNILEKLRYCAL